MKHEFIVYILIFIFSSCRNNSEKNKIELNNDTLNKDELLKIWRNDSTGFSKQGRSIELLNIISTKYNFKNRTCKEISLILEADSNKENCDFLQYKCCGVFFDENGDGIIDSTREFLSNYIYIEFENNKMDTFNLLDR